MIKQKAKKRSGLQKEATPKIFIIVIALIVIFAIGWIAGVVPFTLKAIECGRALVLGTKLAASFSYTLSGDPGYAPGPLQSYYCTEDEAHFHGLQRR